MKMIRGLSLCAVLLSGQASLADEHVPIRQSQPLAGGEGLGTMSYRPLEDELPFVKRITEREIRLWGGVKMPKPSNVSDKDWERIRERDRQIEAKQIPVAQYELGKQAGEYVRWFGIVRSLNFDATRDQTLLLVEHKYFDGLTDIHLQVVSLYGAGDFQVSLPGKVTVEQLPRLGLICVYGKVTAADSTPPLVVPEYVRVWDWGLFTFMDYGIDKSNAAWTKLRKIRPDDVYDSRVSKEYYEARLGPR